VVGATIPGFGLAAQCGNIADPAFLQAFASAHTSAIQPEMACYKCLDWLPIHAVMVLGALGVPVMVTWNGLDRVPDNHPMFFGRPNTWGQRSANILLMCVFRSKWSTDSTGSGPGFRCEAVRILVFTGIVDHMEWNR